MTKLPLVSLRSVASLLPIPKSVPKLPFLMATATPPSESNPTAAAAAATATATDYPVPLTPPYPTISKDVELRRALSASARSASVTLSPIAVLFDDEWISVVNKPSGIYCESILSSLNNTPSRNAAGSNLHLANRLDRDTSGLMVVTKHSQAAAGMVKAFTDHAVSKTYLALCVGGVPEWQQVRVVSGHGRSKHGAWRVYSVDDVGRVLPGGSRVKHMETAFEVLSVNGIGTGEEFPELRKVLNTGTGIGTDTEAKLVLVQDKMSEFGEKESVRRDVHGVGTVEELREQRKVSNTGTDTDTGTDTEAKLVLVRDKISELGEKQIIKRDEVLVRAYPRSGRTHQIRLHCQYLGMPIRGDVKYGGVSERNGAECEFHALHAETLSFTHPITNALLYFKAPLPTWVPKSVFIDNISAG